MSAAKVKKVRALFDYIRRHNDELSFSKNDVITLTQQIEGGWWEGTLNQVTGWFPSNYVTEISDEVTNKSTTDSNKTSSDINLLNFQTDIVNHILDGERKYCSKVNYLLSNFLLPLLKATDINQTKLQRLCDILHAIIPIHKHLVEILEEMKQTENYRVGRLYLDVASKISDDYCSYAGVHLFVIYSIDTNKSAIQQYLESQRISFDWSQMKQQLSLVFDRLSRYSLLLKEMERYLEDGHPDRGDIQRAIVVYTEINEKCNGIRKKKDRDLDVLCATILGWKGERMSQLGDPLLTVKVSYIGPSGSAESQNVLNHVVVVMPTNILLLACTEQADVYAFKSKLPIENLVVYCNKDDKNIEMRSDLTGEYLNLICDSVDTKNDLTVAIRQAQQVISGNKSVVSGDSAASENSGSKSDTADSQHSLFKQTDSSTVINEDQDVSPQLRYLKYICKSSNEQLRILRPDPPASINLINCSPQIPVTRSSSGAGGHFSPKASRRKKEEDTNSRIKDDALVLQVIESYCVSSKGNNSLDLARLRLSDAEIIKTSTGGASVIHQTTTDVIKQSRSNINENVRPPRESSSSSNTTVSGENNHPNRRTTELQQHSCQLNIRMHERGGCSCATQSSVPVKTVGCAPMISGKSKKKL